MGLRNTLSIFVRFGFFRINYMTLQYFSVVNNKLQHKNKELSEKRNLINAYYLYYFMQLNTSSKNTLNTSDF